MFGEEFFLTLNYLLNMPSHCLTAAEEKQKNIDIETICELLNLVLGPQFRRQVDLLIDYLKVSSQYAILFHISLLKLLFFSDYRWVC